MNGQAGKASLARLMKQLRSCTVVWHITRYLISVAALLLIWWGIGELVECAGMSNTE